MSDYSSINTLIGTFSSIDPSYSIHIVDNSSVNIGIYTPKLYFDINKLPDTSNQLTIGQVYFDRSTGILKVKL